LIADGVAAVFVAVSGRALLVMVLRRPQAS
jgi:hypothetical protein